MTVNLTLDDVATIVDHGTVVAITGTDSEDPNLRVTFAGDHRSMEGLVAILRADYEVPAYVEDWMVLSTQVVAS